MKILQKNLWLSLLVAGILVATPTALAGYCGDGAVDAADGEQCDDGNFINLDGCSSYCKFEDITPPKVSSISVPNGATSITSILDKIEIVFDEPIQQAYVDKNNVFIEHQATPINFSLELLPDQKTLVIRIHEDLKGHSRYGIHLRNLRDLPGNFMKEEYISVFDTGDFVDRVAPTIALVPPAGKYSLPQEVSLKAYIDSYTGSDEFLDTAAKIYYTLDGSTPTTSSAQFTQPFVISTTQTIKYFGVDAVGNKSPTLSGNFIFDCADSPNIKQRTPYPECKVLECNYGFILRNNVCVVSLSDDLQNDIEMNAVTAPTLGSNTELMISTKPAIRLTSEHDGTFVRPIVFVDPKLKNTLRFKRNTKITTDAGAPYVGLIKPPVTLFSKDFPINFGYTFKYIIRFAADDGDLNFSPAYTLTIPYTDAFDASKPITVFTYDEKTQKYHYYDLSKVYNNSTQKEVTITASRTTTFFLAQEGQSYNRLEFEDMKDHWARNYAEALFRRGIVKGRTKGQFSPDEPLNRAEFTKIALEAIGAETESIDDIEEPPFPDVVLYAWYTPYIKKAKELGLVKGYPDGTFHPEQPVNRAEAIKILLTALGFDVSADGAGDELTSQYKDLLQEVWYSAFVHFAIRQQLLDGLRNDENNGFFPDWFGPDRAITRGEMAQLAEKALLLKENSN